MSQDIRILGEEKITRLLFKFSVPCVMGLLISAFYNIVDQIFIGNSELGYLGNAATGVSFPVICIANAFAWCVGDGAASYLSICAGCKDTDRAHKCDYHHAAYQCGIGDNMRNFCSTHCGFGGADGNPRTDCFLFPKSEKRVIQQYKKNLQAGMT